MEQRGPAARNSFNKTEGRGEMTKTPVHLQDLRRRIYDKAKSDETWRFWGLYCHVCKMETLREAYRMAKRNNGSPGIDGVTFEDIEQAGVQEFLDGLQADLVQRSYRPLPNRQKAIPKPGTTKVRILGIPCIRDRVVQGALRLILEPVFEADFQEGSFGFRPGRSQHQAVMRVAEAMVVRRATRVIDLDLSAYFDNVRHHLLLQKVAKRVQDPEVLHLLKLILKASGKRGVPQGGVISPLLSNLYLNEVDRMLEKATRVTAFTGYSNVCYTRYADDLVVLVSGREKHRWLVPALIKRLREELGKLEVSVNQEKSKVVDLYRERGSSFGFLGFDFRLVRSWKGKWFPLYTPKLKKRTEIIRRVKEILNSKRHLPVREAIRLINPVLAGWANYFRIGHCSRCFDYVKWVVEKMVRRFIERAGKRWGHGWTRWSQEDIYDKMGLFNAYRRRRYEPKSA